MKKKVVPKLRQEVKVKVDIVTSDDVRIYSTGKFQDFTAKCIIKLYNPEKKVLWLWSFTLQWARIFSAGFGIPLERFVRWGLVRNCL